jgi:hypothetical protein
MEDEIDGIHDVAEDVSPRKEGKQPKADQDKPGEQSDWAWSTEFIRHELFESFQVHFIAGVLGSVP